MPTSLIHFWQKKERGKENFLARNPCLHHGLFSFVCLRGVEEASSYHCECALLRYASRWRRRRRRHTCAQGESMNFARRRRRRPLCLITLFSRTTTTCFPLFYIPLSLSHFPLGQLPPFQTAPPPFSTSPSGGKAAGVHPTTVRDSTDNFLQIRRKKA